MQYAALRGWIDFDFNSFFYSQNNIVNRSFGPMSSWQQDFGSLVLEVFDQQFALGGFSSVMGQAFVLSATLPGDFNGDAVVNTEDINPFILALTQPDDYETVYGTSAAAHEPSGDGLLNTEDINAFIAMLTGSGSAGVVPEPAGGLVLAVGAAALLRRRRR
jgi:hypothetical protein